MAQPITNTVKNTFGFSTPTVSPFQSKTSASPFQSAQTTGPMSVYTPAKTVTTPSKPVTGVVATKPTAKPTVTTQMTPQTNPTPVDNSAKILELQNILAQKRSQLASTQNPTPVQPTGFPGLVSTLAKTAENGSQGVQDATKRLADLQSGIAKSYGNIESTPIPLEFQQGREQALARQYASQLSAAETGVQNALTGQGQQLSALGTAAGLAQPNQAAFGQTVFNPLTGQYEGGGGLPAETLQQYAQMAASGQYSAIPSSITSNPVLSAQLNQAAKALNPNYSPITSAAQGEVLASLPELEAASTQAEGIKNKIVSYLNSNPGLNPSTLAAGNILQQWIQGKQLADPRYQNLFNYLNEYTSTLAPILGVGGDTTNLKTEIAQSFINAKASGQSIAQVLDAMSQLAQGKIQDRRSGALGGGVVSSPGSTAGTPSFAEQW